MSKSSYIKKTLLILIIISAAIAGFITSNNYFNKTSDVNYQSLRVYPQAKSFSGFKLVDQDNKTISIENFANKWTLLFFGFTSCPDVCPTTLTEIQKIYKQLNIQGSETLPQVMFVSVDPDRDTPEVLKNYIDFFNPEFIAASADAGNLLSITSQIGVAYSVEDHDDTEKNYNVDHTAAIFVINPDKKLHGLFLTPHDAEKITADLILLMGEK